MEQTTIAVKTKGQLGRPLKWLVCQLHMKKLPFRKYFFHVDCVQTTGPARSSGVIVKVILFNPKVILIVDFFPTAEKVVDVSDMVHKDLSTDQRYLLKALQKECLIVLLERDSSQYTLFTECSQPGSINNERLDGSRKQAKSHVCTCHRLLHQNRCRG